MIVCHALIIVCVHTHAHQDFSVAIWIRRRKFMNAQEHISSSWFCTLKMHDLTKICQSHKSHLPCRWASFSTNFIFNIKVDKRPKEVESARKFELFFSHHHLFFFFCNYCFCPDKHPIQSWNFQCREPCKENASYWSELLITIFDSNVKCL